MEFINSSPTEDERNKILSPYATNDGENWTAELLAEYINTGTSCFQGDNELEASIKQSFEMLRNKSS